MPLLKMADAAYFAHPAVNKSSLDLVAKSPAHYKEWLSNPTKRTRPMAFGSAVHCATLEPGEFKLRYAVAPQGHTRLQKKAWEDLTLACAGRELLTYGEAVQIDATVRALAANPRAWDLLRGEGPAEMAALWTNNSGLECKAKFDKLRAMGRGIIVDLKTAQDASPKGFRKACRDHRYDVQAAWYWDAFVAVMGCEPEAFIFAVVESDAPHCVALYHAEPDFLADGRRKYMHDLEILMRCTAEGVWEPWPQDLLPLHSVERW